MRHDTSLEVQSLFIRPLLHPVLPEGHTLHESWTVSPSLLDDHGTNLVLPPGVFSLGLDETFGFAGGMSSSFFWADEHIFDILDERGCQDVEFYLDSGSPADNYQITLQMRDRLNALGCEHTHLVEEGGLHEWSYWHGRVHGLLEAFLSN
ncbi:MAG: hypothetical protein ACNA8W_06255 [Bradymonadaceae bacterium]